MNSKQVIQIVKPDPIFTNRSTSLVYTLRLSGEDKYVLTMEAGPNPYLFSSDSSIERTDRKTTVLPLGPREPVFIYEEVDIEEWKKALDYDVIKNRWITS